MIYYYKLFNLKKIKIDKIRLNGKDVDLFEI